MSELYHYGRPRQKWGVRNYQNPDGTWTELGKERRRIGRQETKPKNWLEGLKAKKAEKKRKQEEEKRKQEEELKRNIASGAKEYFNTLHSQGSSKEAEDKKDAFWKKNGIEKAGDDYVIRKGTDITRFSTASIEDYTSRPLYGAILQGDVHDYEEWMYEGYFGYANDRLGYKYTLTTQRDLRTANGKKVVSYISDNFGSQEFKDAWKVYQDLELDKNEFKTYNNNPYENYASENNNIVYNNLQKMLYKNKEIQADVVKHFKEEGYDVIVDAEDWCAGVNFPIIVINPGKDLSVKQVEGL